MEIEVRSNLLRSLNYIWANIVISLKRLVEYKASLYTSVLEQFFYYLVFFVFFFVISDNFGEIIGWTLFDFLMFGILIDLIHVIPGAILWRIGLQSDLKTGDFNQYLFRPVNPWVGHQFSRMFSGVHIFIITNILIIPLLIFIFKPQLSNVLLVIPLLILILFSFTALEISIKSFNFISYGLNDFLFRGNDTINFSIIKNYPFSFFSESKLRFCLLGFPLLYTGSLLIPLLRGYEIWRIELQIILIILVFMVCSLITYFNWKRGLKRYSAFG